MTLMNAFSRMPVIPPYIAGDHGASAEGSLVGAFNEMSYFNGVPETVAEQLEHLDEWGGPTTFPHYAAGWAIAGDAPFSWAKQVASNFGGTAAGTVIRWPKGVNGRGEVRAQFTHVVDVAPTILEVAGLPVPKSVNGVPQKGMEGVSFAYTFRDAQAKSRHHTQYFEIAGNRAIYHDGWLAGTVHKAPWEADPRATLDHDRWELYDRRTDWSLANDLAARNPQKLREMQRLFLQEAAKYHVLPIDDRTIERLDPGVAGRPDLMGSRTSLTLYEGMTGILENAFINVKNRSYTITAQVEIPSGGANGVILAQGGRFGGWSLYLKDGRPAYAYNWIGRESYTVASPHVLPPGPATIRLDFAYEGGGRGKGGAATLSVDGQTVANGQIRHTNANVFSLDEGTDVGIDEGTPVSDAYGERDNRFTGKIHEVTVEVR